MCSQSKRGNLFSIFTKRYVSTLSVPLVALAAYILLLPDDSYAFESAKFAIEEICGHMQGKLGGLLMTVAGIGGLTAAAFGNMRASQGLIVVGVGAFAISSVLSIYFPQAATSCNNGANGNAAGRTIQRTAANPANPFNVVEADLAARRTVQALQLGAGKTVDFNTAASLPTPADEVEDEPFQFDPTTAETADQF